jgi:glycosyltransferase involved in cell wall biosynthesis
MKIGIIETNLSLKTGGGSHIHLHLFASELSRLGHEVTVITLDPSLNAYPDNLPYSVIGEDPISNRFDRGYRLLLQKVLHKYQGQFDVYHLWQPFFLSGGGLYRRLGGKVPVVANLIAFWFCPNWTLIDMKCCRHCGIMQKTLHRREKLARKVLLLPFRALESRLANSMSNHVDAFLPVTDDMAKIYSWQHLDWRKMRVIPAPIDYQYLRRSTETRASEPLCNRRYNILYVGRLSPEKGVDILINAVARLDFPASLHIAGDGPQRKELELLAKNLKISDRVTFHGWVPHEKVPDFYLSSQLFVHPARWPEVFCLSVLEAMALGTPVIVADYGDAALELNDAALTFKRTDIDDLVQKIRLVYQNSSLASVMVQKAQEMAKAFDYRKAVSSLIKVYTDVIKGPTKGG